MSEVDRSTADLIVRLRDLQARSAEIDEAAAVVKAELRHRLEPGTHTINGARAVTLTSNRRFDPSRAEARLPDDLLVLCTKPKLDAAMAKRMLPPAVFESCCSEGEPVVRLA